MQVRPAFHHVPVASLNTPPDKRRASGNEERERRSSLAIRRFSLFCLAGFSRWLSRRWDCHSNILCYKVLSKRAGPIFAGPLRPEQSIFHSRGFEVPKRQRRSGLCEGLGKFGLDRFKRRLQAVVDGHEFETLNLFSGQYEGREMKGIECSQ